MIALLGSLVSNVGASFAGLFSATVVKKAVVVSAMIVVILALVAALWLAIKTAIATVAVVMPSALLIGISWVVPTNFAEAATALASIRVADFIFSMRTKTTVASAAAK